MSIRCDTSSLIAGSIVCGVPGLGILGSVILATTGEGGSGPGILFNDVQAGDENKEFRGLRTSGPASGVFVLNENGTFTFTGPSADSFQYQLYVDGVAVGSPATVSLYAEATGLDVAASGLASVTHTATGAVSADVLAFIDVAAGGQASVTYEAVGGGGEEGQHGGMPAYYVYDSSLEEKPAKPTPAKVTPPAARAEVSAPPVETPSLTQALVDRFVDQQIQRSTGARAAASQVLGTVPGGSETLPVLADQTMSIVLTPAQIARRLDDEEAIALLLMA